MAPGQSAFFAGGSPSKAPRFGTSKPSSQRPYTPGMTRDELAEKRAVEFARQKNELHALAGKGKGNASLSPPATADEPRTSFSDDMGKAFDDIGLAASKPLPPSLPATPQKQRTLPSSAVDASQGNGNAKGASALGKTSNSSEAPDQLAAPATNKAPSVRNVSNPVKDVTSVDLDGIPVFFIDDGGLPTPVNGATSGPFGGDKVVEGDHSSKPTQDRFSPSAAEPSAAPTGSMGAASAGDVPTDSHLTPETHSDSQPLSSQQASTEQQPVQPPQPEPSGHALTVDQRLAKEAQRRTFGQTPDTSTLPTSSSPLPSTESGKDSSPQRAGILGAAVGAAGAGAAAFGLKQCQDRAPSPSETPEGAQPAQSLPSTSAETASATPTNEAASKEAIGGTLQTEQASISSGVRDSDAPVGVQGEGATSASERAPHVETTDADAQPAPRSGGTIPSENVPESASGGVSATEPGAADVTQLTAQSSSPPPGASTVPAAAAGATLAGASGIEGRRPSRPRAMSSASITSAVPDDYDPTCVEQDQYRSSEDPRMGGSTLSISGSVLSERDQVSPQGSAFPDDVGSPPPARGGGESAQQQQWGTQGDVAFDSVTPTGTGNGRETEIQPGAGTRAGEVAHIPSEALGGPATSNPATSSQTTSFQTEGGIGTAAAIGAGAAVGAGAIGALAARTPGTPTSREYLSASPSASPGRPLVQGMPEGRSMSAASMVAIKDGRAGHVSIKTSGLVDDVEPKTGDTLGTPLSVTPSESSLVANETRRGEDPAASTASITAIRGGREGAPPSPPGRSPLSESNRLEDLLNNPGAGGEDGGVKGPVEVTETGTHADAPLNDRAGSATTEAEHSSHSASGLAAGAAGAALTGGTVVASRSGHEMASEPGESATAPMQTSQTSPPTNVSLPQGDNLQHSPTPADIPTSEPNAAGGARSQTPREGAESRGETEGFRTATATPYNESFRTASLGDTPGESGEATPRAPGDYVAAGKASADEPRVGQAAGVAADATEAGMTGNAAERDPTSVGVESTGNATPPSTSAAAAAAGAAAAGTTAGREGSANAGSSVRAAGDDAYSAQAGPTANGSTAVNDTSAGSRSAAVPASSRPVPTSPKPAHERKVSVSAPVVPPKGHSRSDSKSSSGSKRKVGFLSKIKGEIKVISGKIKHDEKRVAEGERLKNGE